MWVDLNHNKGARQASCFSKGCEMGFQIQVSRFLGCVCEITLPHKHVEKSISWWKQISRTIFLWYVRNHIWSSVDTALTLSLGMHKHVLSHLYPANDWIRFASLYKRVTIEKCLCEFYQWLEVLIGMVISTNLIWFQSQPVASSNLKKSESAQKNT